LLSLPTHVLKTPEGAQVVFNRGGQRVAMDLSDISALHEGVELRFSVHLGTLGPQSLALRRLHALLEGRSAAGLWTPIPRAGRVANMLTALDARGVGASLREIAEVLFGPARVASTWNGSSDFLKSRVRRLVRDARKMSEGGYRRLLRGSS
jgi:hypothetical protein